MKKIGQGCWEYKGFTIFKEKTLIFPYLIYDEEGFVVEGFTDLGDCKKFIDEKN